jgi:lipopolysaccharide/colanic/teichoic acid biosynthesis glycosyltransferase
MTGLAQIHGYYDSWVGNKLRYDLAYIVNSSFLLDIKILFMTIKETLRGHRIRNSVSSPVNESTVHIHKKS